ncbi:unnamed protein product, partial [marine sediment metagenome]
ISSRFSSTANIVPKANSTGMHTPTNTNVFRKALRNTESLKMSV